jgi:hypothetical protein
MTPPIPDPRATTVAPITPERWNELAKKYAVDGIMEIGQLLDRLDRAEAALADAKREAERQIAAEMIHAAINQCEWSYPYTSEEPYVQVGKLADAVETIAAERAQENPRD